MGANFTSEQVKLMQKLGSESAYKLDTYSLSSVKSKFSHIKHLMEAVESNINDARLKHNANQLIDSLKNAFGKPLVNSYKRQIAYTLKQILPDSDVKPELYKESENQTSVGRPTSSQLTSNHLHFLRELLKKACQFVTNEDILTPATQVPFEAYDFIDVYDTLLCVIITSTTLLRFEAIMHMKMSHLDMILSEQPIPIPSKYSHTGKTSKLRLVVKNDFLLKLIEVIRKNRPRIVQILKELKNLGIRKLESKEDRLVKNFILLTSQANMRRKLRKIALTVKTDKPVHFQTLGYNHFRKLTTSILVEEGGLDVAQLMNSHSSSKTTLDHYTIQNTQALNVTFDSMQKQNNLQSDDTNLDVDEEMDL